MFGKKIKVLPTRYYVAHQGWGKIELSSYPMFKAEAQATADRWTSMFDRSHWIVTEDEYHQIIASQKTKVLERELGIK